MVLILVNNLVSVESAFVFSYLNYSKLHYNITGSVRRLLQYMAVATGYSTSTLRKDHDEH